jgi:L-iditol 2-dehydrogenase
MKALVLHGVRDLRVEERPKPEPGPGQALVRIRSVGVCGSDVHYYTHMRIGDQVVTRPMIPGHEAAGEVAALGPGVEGVATGDRIAIEPARSCGRCEFCRTGRPNICPQVVFRSTPPNDGLMCEFAAIEAAQGLPVPDAISFDEAAMLEPLQVAVHAANLSGLVPGETVAVIGCGAIGLGCLEMARAGGAGRILATDRFDYRLALARKLGADETIHAERADPVKTLKHLTAGRGADLVFECTNRAAGAPQAYDAAAIGGRVILVGIPEEDTITLDAHEYRRKELRVQYVRRSRHAARAAIALLAAGRLQVKPWVTHTFALKDAAKAFEMVDKYADGVLKAVVRP